LINDLSTKKLILALDLFNKFEYESNKFGPYSFKLADQIENLCDLKLVKKTKDEKHSSADELNYYGEITAPFRYELTKYGKLIAKDVFEKLDENEQQELNLLKKKFNSKSLHALLSYVYNRIDKEWLEKSEIRDQYVLY
jgi:uncharacterized protein YwgA